MKITIDTTVIRDFFFLINNWLLYGHTILISKTDICSVCMSIHPRSMMIFLKNDDISVDN